MKHRYTLLVFVLLILMGLAFWFYFGKYFSEKSVSSTSKLSSKHHDDKEKPIEHVEHGEDEHDSHQGEDHKDEEKHEENKEGEEKSVGGVGKNNAVTAADEHTGIQLSEKAIALIQLKMETYGAQAISKNALVYYQDQVGVYRFRETWFKLIPVQILNREAEKVSILSADLKPGDQIVTQGTGLLRAAELDAFSSEAGHSH